MIDETQNNDRKSLICPICSTVIFDHEEKIECPNCKIVYHKDCWIDNDGCATYGCKSTGCLKPEPLKIHISETESENQDIKCPYCHIKLVSGCIVCWSCNKEIPRQFFTRNIKLADPWLRWGARHCDLFVESLLAVLLVIFFSFIINNQMIISFVFILTLPLIIIIDTLIYELFGNSFGRWCYGLQVINRKNTKICVKEYFYRNWRVLFYGLGLMLPIINLISMWTQYQSLKKHNSSIYDKKFGYSVISYEPLCIWKLIIGIIISSIYAIFLYFYGLFVCFLMFI